VQVSKFGDAFLTGDIALYNKGGQPCVLVADSGHQSFRRGPPAAPGGTRIWIISPGGGCLTSRPTGAAAAPLDQLKAAAKSALDQVVEFAANRTEAALCALDGLAAAQLASGVRKWGTQILRLMRQHLGWQPPRLSLNG
jgi:hypothetical protein